MADDGKVSRISVNNGIGATAVPLNLSIASITNQAALKVSEFQ
jgi:hypothetical protein